MMEEQEKCPYFDCIMCRWGVCVGDKQLWIELNNCKKANEDSAI